jgi:hypothetical protein
MASQGTPNSGLDDIAAAAYVSGELTLIAYTNAAGSLGAGTVAGDLVQPAQNNGYTPIVLDGTWASVNGVVTYDHPGFPTWSTTGAWSAVVTGVAILRAGILRHFKDLDSAFTAASNKKLAVDLLSVIG